MHARFVPCEADVSQRWADAHSDCSRGLVRLRLRHDALQGTPRHLRTSGVGVPVVLERLSNTPARLPEASQAVVIVDSAHKLVA